MLDKRYTIPLNTLHKGHKTTDIHVNQGDTRSVIFDFRVYAGAEEINYEDVETAVLFMTKPDQNIVQVNADNTGSGFTCTLSQQALASPGAVVGGLALYGHEMERITTLFFIFWVARDPISADIVDSTTEFDALAKAITMLRWLQDKAAQFPNLTVLGRFETEAELLATFPDGTNVGGSFFVGSEEEARYFYWSLVTDSWESADPWRGRTGRHFISVDVPATAQDLHSMGVRLGDTVVVSVDRLIVAGEMRATGDLLERSAWAIEDESFTPAGSIRGARGEPGTVNARGTWGASVEDYQRYDVVIYNSPRRTRNAYIYMSWDAGSQLTPHSTSPDNPWVIWAYEGLQGEAATIEVGHVTTLPSDAEATVTNSGTKYNAKLDIGIPQGRAATLKIVKVVTGEAGTDASVENIGTAEDAEYVLTIPRGTMGFSGDHANLDNLAFEDSNHTGFASKEDIDATKQQLATAKDDISAQIAKMEGDVSTQMSALQSGVGDKMAALEKDVAGQIDTLNAHVDNTIAQATTDVNQSLEDLKTAVNNTVQTLAGTLEGIPMASKLDPLDFTIRGDGSIGRPMTLLEAGGTSFANSPAISIGPWIYVWCRNNQGAAHHNFLRIHTQQNTMEFLNVELPNVGVGSRATTMFSHMSYNDGYVYLMSANGAARFFRYCIANDSWEELASFPIASGVGLQGGWIGNKLYGMGATTNPSLIFSYDADTDVWEEHFNFAHSGRGAFAVNNPVTIHDGQLYMFGTNQQIGRWNPVTNTLTLLANAPVTILVGRAWTGPDNAIWVHQQGAAASASRLLRYDPVANTWQNFGLGQITTAACICPVGSIIYYVGQTLGDIQHIRLPATTAPIITALPAYTLALRMPPDLHTLTTPLIAVNGDTVATPAILRRLATKQD
ncbi:MAG: phage baseplate upper protein [Defluviitaleaceae bacterium]|nr:phage baseplate upper protein [Defluviitaleaceae bacterium]